MLCFTCGKRKSCSTIKKSQNITNMIVDRDENTTVFFILEEAKETVLDFSVNYIEDLLMLVSIFT